jgi:hypothetical protein
MGKKIDRSVKGLHEALFNMIEKLSDDELQGEKLVGMIDRSDAIVRSAAQLNSAYDKAIKAAQMVHAASPKSGEAAALLLEVTGHPGVAALEKK